MKIKGIDFGKVMVASGGNNFSGEGWPYDRLYRFIPGYTLKGTTDCTKTFTVEKRNNQAKGLGNMDIDEETFWPKKRFPPCVKVDFLRCQVLNAVGLTNLGLKNHLRRLQDLIGPFFVSLMSIKKTKKERLEETRKQINLLREFLFCNQYAIVRNFTCPNTHHDLRTLEDEIKEHLLIDSRLGVPSGIKINLQTSTETVKEIVDDGFCDFIDVPNSYPLIDMPGIRECRQARFILETYNNQGGYSGPLQTSSVRYWIKLARAKGIDVPIIAGSVYSKEHVKWMHEAGANAVALGSVKLLRPWRLKGMIKLANQLF